MIEIKGLVVKSENSNSVLGYITDIDGIMKVLTEDTMLMYAFDGELKNGEIIEDVLDGVTTSFLDITTDSDDWFLMPQEEATKLYGEPI